MKRLTQSARQAYGRANDQADAPVATAGRQLYTSDLAYDVGEISQVSLTDTARNNYEILAAERYAGAACPYVARGGASETAGAAVSYRRLGGLPDQLHCVWTLPPGDDDFSNRWRAIKIRFVQALTRAEAGIKWPGSIYFLVFWNRRELLRSWMA